MRTCLLFAVSLVLLSLAALPYAPALAQSLPGNSRAPIDIQADALEVRQAENLAIFSGNVEARQDTMILRAQEMAVHYRDSGTPKNTNADAGGPPARIQRIVATGDVSLVTADEIMKGRRAVFDVAGDTVTVTGGVVLTRGQHVITGSSMAYDVATRRSRVLSSATTTADGTPAAPKERVRALFVPEPSAP